MMMMSAGRLRNRMSQLSKNRFNLKERPIAKPIAEPMTTAIAKLATTRANVTPT